jgi:hypothetical protein
LLGAIQDGTQSAQMLFFQIGGHRRVSSASIRAAVVFLAAFFFVCCGASFKSMWIVPSG